MSPLKKLTLQEIQSARFDAWTKFHDLAARLQENRPNVTAEMVEQADARLKEIDAEMKRRRS